MSGHGREPSICEGNWRAGTWGGREFEGDIMSSTLQTNVPAFEKQSTRGRVPGNRDRAIVIGGSMAGLAMVRVLSDHYREVNFR